MMKKVDIKWNLLSAITSKINPNSIIFEAPLEISASMLNSYNLDSD